MIWQNPWAWLGLLTLAVPILVHLLARQRARVQRFPTLRFIEPSHLIMARRAWPTDLLLLAVRLWILLLAVAALAQPYLLGAERMARLTRTVSRAIVVDTSASMQRVVASTDGAAEPAVGRARREAQAVADGATAGTISTIIETATPAIGVAGAAAWLETQPGAGELIVISDFQRGTLDAADLERVPAHRGIDLRRIDTTVDAAGPLTAVLHSATGVATSVTALEDGTEVTWSTVDAMPAPAADALVVLHGTADVGAARAARAAGMQAAGAPAIDSTRPITIALRSYDGRAALLDAARPLDTAWMGDVIVALHEDRLLAAAAAAEAEPGAAVQATVGGADEAGRSPFMTVAYTRAGEPVVRAASVTVAGTDRLLLLVDAPAGSLTAAATIAAAARAATVAAPMSELESATVSDAMLAGWRRPSSRPPGPPASVPSGQSDGRWLWAAVLALLALETWLRRRQNVSASPATEATRPHSADTRAPARETEVHVG